jgi:hypothetical protein
VVGVYGVRPRAVGVGGMYGRGVVRRVAFMPRPIRGRRYKPLRVGFVVRFVVAGVASPSPLGGALGVESRSPTGVLVKRRGTLRAKRVFGPALRPRLTRRFFSSFAAMV